MLQPYCFMAHELVEGTDCFKCVSTDPAGKSQLYYSNEPDHISVLMHIRHQMYFLACQPVVVTNTSNLSRAAVCMHALGTSMLVAFGYKYYMFHHAYFYTHNLTVCKIAWQLTSATY